MALSRRTSDNLFKLAIAILGFAAAALGVISQWRSTSATQQSAQPPSNAAVDQQPPAIPAASRELPKPEVTNRNVQRVKIQPLRDVESDVLRGTSSASVDVTGKWTGQWKDPGGALFALDMSLQLANETVVTGTIQWTLKLSPRFEEQTLIGRSGIELVRGSLNPDSRLLLLQGYEKNDPYHVIDLDSYRLTVSDDSRAITGKTKNHGPWDATFEARRPNPQ
jgi:hypothetical protein